MLMLSVVHFWGLEELMLSWSSCDLEWVLYRDNAANIKMCKNTTVHISFKGSGPVSSHVRSKDGLSIWWTCWQKGLLLVFFLSVGNDVNQVLVVQVPCHIWGEGYEHLLHLTNKKQILPSLPQRQHISVHEKVWWWFTEGLFCMKMFLTWM